MQSPRTGSCLCGGVRYAVSGPLRECARCHCVQCRKASGAEFATNATVDAAHFRWLTGEELLREHESSPGQARVFCGRCGSPLLKRRRERPQELRLRLGCLDAELAREEAPLHHLFVAEKPAWSEIHDPLPRFAALSGEGDAPEADVRSAESPSRRP